MRFTYQYQGQTYTLDMVEQADGQYAVTIGERTIPLHVESLPDGSYRFQLDGELHTVYTASDKDQRYIQTYDADYTLTVPTKSARRKTASAGDELVAQMPGQVTAVLVKAGDDTTRGQTLLILEAMKMEIRVTAPADGRVGQILVQQGAVVERGQRLVVFEAKPV